MIWVSRIVSAASCWVTAVSGTWASAMEPPRSVKSSGCQAKVVAPVAWRTCPVVSPEAVWTADVMSWSAIPSGSPWISASSAEMVA